MNCNAFIIGPPSLTACAKAIAVAQAMADNTYQKKKIFIKPEKNAVSSPLSHKASADKESSRVISTAQL